MSTAGIWQTESSSSEDTYAIGERYGRACRGGELFVLSGDLGSGKTTFTKGLASGLGYTGILTSPTFTISRTYKCRDGMTLHHFDFYRLQAGGVVAHELSEVAQDPAAVVVVEWGDIVQGELPPEYIKLQFSPVAESAEKRALSASFPIKYGYIFEEKP